MLQQQLDHRHRAHSRRAMQRILTAAVADARRRRGLAIVCKEDAGDVDGVFGGDKVDDGLASVVCLKREGDGVCVLARSVKKERMDE